MLSFWERNELDNLPIYPSVLEWFCLNHLVGQLRFEAVRMMPVLPARSRQMFEKEYLIMAQVTY